MSFRYLLRLTLLTAALAASQTREVYALDAERQLWHYGSTNWRDKEGLPQNTVRAIAQTTDGYIWAGTESGLARYNGRAFHVFDPGNEPAFSNKVITALAASRDGSLWIGTQNGLLRYRNYRFERMPASGGLAGENIRALQEDAAGAIWVCTQSGVTRLDTGARVNASNVRSAAVVGREMVLVGTTRGLLARDLAGRRLPLPEGLPDDTVRAALRDRAGRLWVGTENSGLYVIEGGRLRRYTTADGLSHLSVRALLEDRDGNLWIGTMGGGLNRFRDGRFHRLTRAEGLASDHVRALFEDREGNLWLGMEAGGLTQLKNGRVMTLTTQDGLGSDFIRAVRGTRNGDLLVGTEGAGLFRLRAGAARMEEVGELGLPKAFVTALLEDKQGNLWVGTEGNGAVRLPAAGERRVFSTAAGRAENSAWALAEDINGAVWIGTSNGLLRAKDGQVTRLGMEQGLRSPAIRSLHAARDGALWVTFRGPGLQRWKDGAAESVALPREAASAPITSFLEEPDGSLWITSGSGLLHWRANGGARLLSESHGLFSSNLYEVLDDGNGRLWFSSGKGIFAVRREDLLAVLDGRATGVSYTSFTTADGMRSSECSGDAQPAGWRSAVDGSLWFSTIRGLIRIEPRRLRTNPVPPSVAVEGVEVNGVAVDNWRDGVQSPPGHRLLTVRFAALSFAAPEKVRYRYRLAGVDDDWLEKQGLGEAVYHSLPPGRYNLRVMAANEDGVWSREAAGFELKVEPYFHETGWFYGLCAALLALAAYAAHALRTRAMRHEFAAVLGERTRIAREIHDTLLQGFAGAALQLGAISRKLTGNPAAAKQDLEGVLDQIDGCLADARREIGELRASGQVGSQGAEALEERIRRAATQASAGYRLEVGVVVHGERRALPPEVEKNLVRIAHEAVVNAARHAHARRVRIDLHFEPRRFRLLAQDDGQGFAEEHTHAKTGQPPTHFGLAGMRERAALLGAEFILRSEANSGTGIEVILPFRGVSAP